MVCQRCVASVKQVFNEMDLDVSKIELGEVDTEEDLPKEELKKLDEKLRSLGFELITSRTNKIIEDIKKLILEYIDLGIDS